MNIAPAFYRRIPKLYFDFTLLWVLVTSLVFPSVINSSLIAALFCISTYQYWSKEFTALWGETKLAWLGITVFLFIGVALSELPEKSAKGAYDILRCIALFYFVTPFLRKTSNKALLHSLRYYLIFASCLFFVAVVWIQISESSMIIRETQIGNLVFKGYHHFINSIAVITVLACCSTVNRSLSWRWALPVFTLLFYCLLFSFSRGNWLALIFVATLLLSYQNKIFIHSWLCALVLFYIAYTYVFFLMPCPEDSCNITVFNRQHIYLGTVAYIGNAPIFGFGLSVFKIISNIREAGFIVIMPHNIFLECLYSVGAIGTISICSSFLIFFTKSRWSTKAILSAHPLPIQVLISISLIVYLLIRGTFDFKLADSPTFGLIAISIAFLYARKPAYSTNLSANKHLTKQ